MLIRRSRYLYRRVSRSIAGALLNRVAFPLFDLERGYGMIAHNSEHAAW
jgi:hypothetical protein